MPEQLEPPRPPRGGRPNKTGSPKRGPSGYAWPVLRVDTGETIEVIRHVDAATVEDVTGRRFRVLGAGRVEPVGEN